MDQYRGRVINTCYGFTRNEQDAEDVAQEVFLQVFRDIEKFNGKVPLWVWIYRLAVNKSVDFLRAGSRAKRRSSLKKLFGDAPIELTEHPDTGPLQSLENEELKTMLDSAIRHLPARQKTAFVLSRHEELPNARIAEIMNISEGAVESLITRANKTLRKLLENYYNSWR